MWARILCFLIVLTNNAFAVEPTNKLTQALAGCLRADLAATGSAGPNVANHDVGMNGSVAALPASDVQPVLQIKCEGAAAVALKSAASEALQFVDRPYAG